LPREELVNLGINFEDEGDRNLAGELFDPQQELQRLEYATGDQIMVLLESF
jgi:hypothetical protein